MASYNVLITKSAAKDLAPVPITDRRPIVAKVLSLADDPRHVGCETLSGDEKYRLRQGDCRILYEILDSPSRRPFSSSP